MLFIMPYNLIRKFSLQYNTHKCHYSYIGLKQILSHIRVIGVFLLSEKFNMYSCRIWKLCEAVLHSKTKNMFVNSDMHMCFIDNVNTCDWMLEYSMYTGVKSWTCLSLHYVEQWLFCCKYVFSFLFSCDENTTYTVIYIS